jgi:Myb-like DNA-binding domain
MEPGTASATRALRQDEDALRHLACRPALAVTVWGGRTRRAAVMTAMTRAHGALLARAAITRVARAAAASAAARAADALEDYATELPERRARLRVADIVDATAVVDPRIAPLPIRLAMQRARIYAAMHFLAATNIPHREALDSAFARLSEISVYDDELDPGETDVAALIDDHSQDEDSDMDDVESGFGRAHDNSLVADLHTEGIALLRAGARHLRLEGKTSLFRFIASYERARPVLSCVRELRGGVAVVAPDFGRKEHTANDRMEVLPNRPRPSRSKLAKDSRSSAHPGKHRREASRMHDPNYQQRHKSSRKVVLPISAKDAPRHAYRDRSGAKNGTAQAEDEEIDVVLDADREDGEGADDDDTVNNEDRNRGGEDDSTFHNGEVGTEECSDENGDNDAKKVGDEGNASELSVDEDEDAYDDDRDENANADEADEIRDSHDRDQRTVNAVAAGKRVVRSAGKTDRKAKVVLDQRKQTMTPPINAIDVPLDDVLNANEMQFSDDDPPRDRALVHRNPTDGEVGIVPEDGHGHDRQTRRKAIYIPAKDARIASPISDSENDDEHDSDSLAKTGRVFRKRRKISIELSPVKSPKKWLTTAYARFTPSEDEKLMHGLKKYGWGFWTAIANSYEWDHQRTPVNLKDRARTLRLNSKHYPEPLHPLPDAPARRGRPPKKALSTTGSHVLGSRRRSTTAMPGFTPERTTATPCAESEDDIFTNSDDDEAVNEND